MVLVTMDNAYEQPVLSMEKKGTHTKISQKYYGQNIKSFTTHKLENLESIHVYYYNDNGIEVSKVYRTASTRKMYAVYWGSINDIKNLQLTFYFITSSYSIITRAHKYLVITKDYDRIIVNIVSQNILTLNAGSELKSESFKTYMKTNRIFADIVGIGPEQFNLNYVITLPLSIIPLKIAINRGTESKPDLTDYHKIINRSGIITFSGTFVFKPTAIIYISRTYLKAPENIIKLTVKLTLSNQLSVIKPVIPTLSTPILTAEKVRIAIDGVKYDSVKDSFWIHVTFVPPNLDDSIERIYTYSSLITNPTNRVGKNYVDRTEDDFYQIIINDNETRHVYVLLRQTDLADIISPTVIIVRTGNFVELSLVNKIIPLVQLINIFATEVSDTSITFRMQDNLLLSDKIDSLQLSTLIGSTQTNHEIINNQQHNYLEFTFPGLTAETLYTFSLKAKIGDIYEDITTVDIRTVMSISSSSSDLEKQKQAVAKILCESLPDKKAMEVMLLPFDNQIKVVENIISYKTIVDGLYFGVDRNKNNYSHKYGKKPEATEYSSEINIIAKDLVAAEILVIPEPHENTDLIQEPY